MTLTVHDLNESPPARAAELFRSCCGSTEWVSLMCALRPFTSVDDVLAQADDVWLSLDPDDWREAFAHHPRIGERRSEAPQTERASSWSTGEQARVMSAGRSMQEELAAANREYEARFGYIYIVCATGKTAGELLAMALQRMNNTPAAELEVAAEEQRKITQLRLQKLFAEPA